MHTYVHFLGLFYKHVNFFLHVFCSYFSSLFYDLHRRFSMYIYIYIYHYTHVITSRKFQLE